MGIYILDTCKFINIPMKYISMEIPIKHSIRVKPYNSYRSDMSGACGEHIRHAASLGPYTDTVFDRDLYIL
jgi:hypothetical protein